MKYLLSLPSDPSDMEILKAEESLIELLAPFVASNTWLTTISQRLMDDGLVPVLAKLIPLQASCPAELQSMHPAVRLSAAKACVVILPIASFNDHLIACFDLVFDAFCAETDPPILLELMKVVMSENCHSQFYSKMDAVVHKMGLLIGSPNIQLAVACTEPISTIFDEFFQDDLDLFARSGMIELFVQSLSTLVSFVFALLNGAKDFPGSKMYTNMEDYAALPGSVMPDPRTLVELRYLEFIGSLLAKSNWWEKIHDEPISADGDPRHWLKMFPRPHRSCL
ncbi:hypothetical protein BASA81_015544 [Batrachochytrium salamandrivorans]|nr:hypothetical protein BASA81_015544 [Batrachochytrium salamandrivorans]